MDSTSICAPAKDKIEYLDAIRGIAASIVVISHFSSAFFPFAVFGDRYAVHHTVEHLFHYPPFSNVHAGHFAVCLFFILSGFVLAYPLLKNDNRKLLRATIKRPIRLLGIVLVTIGLGYLLQSTNCLCNTEVGQVAGSSKWLGRFWSEKAGASEFVFDMSVMPFQNGNKYNPPLWTIEKELFGSYIVFAYVFMARRASSRTRIVILGALSVIFASSLYLGFVIGIALAELQIRTRPSNVWQPWMWGPLLLGLILAGNLHYAPVPDFSSNWYGVISKRWHRLGSGGEAMIGAFILFALVLRCRTIQKLLEHPGFFFLGKISYSMYALHFLMLGSLTSGLYLLGERWFGHSVAAIFATLVSIGVLIPLSLLLTNTVDKWSIQLADKAANWFVPLQTRLETQAVPRSEGTRKDIELPAMHKAA